MIFGPLKGSDPLEWKKITALEEFDVLKPDNLYELVIRIEIGSGAKIFVIDEEGREYTHNLSRNGPMDCPVVIDPDPLTMQLLFMRLHQLQRRT